MSVAEILTPALAAVCGGQLPVRIRAWDDSTLGPADGPEVTLRSPDALRHLVWAPGEIGLARAVVSGALELGATTAEIEAVLATAGRWSRDRGGPPRLGARALLAVARAALRTGLLSGRPAVPAQELRPRGRAHSRVRDHAVIAHHYDLSNDFYRLVLDPSMAYSCGYWSELPDAGADLTDGLARAQQDKLALVCGKLGLTPGMRLLDIGCGWGALITYAARVHGVQATGLTLSAQQYVQVRELIGAAGPTDPVARLVSVRHTDYRDLPTQRYDAISVIEMGEHVGAREYPAFLARLRGLLAPHGTLLIQQMSRTGAHQGGGAFIERYIAPDMHMRPVAETTALLTEAGLRVKDVQPLGEHYPPTIRAWARLLDQHRAEAEDLVGPAMFRTWQLYLAGSALAFAEGRMGVEQLVAVPS